MVSIGWSFYWKKLCDPVTGKSKLVRFEFEDDGTVLRTNAFNIDGSAYSGNIMSLEDCPTSPISNIEIRTGWSFAWHTMEEPTTGDPISVRVDYKDDGTILRVKAFYQDKTPYTGDLNALVEYVPIDTGGVAISAGTNVVSSGTVIFSNANSVSFGLSGQVLTASINPPNAAVGSISASGGSASLGQVLFANDHGLTFGLVGQTITASYTVPSTTGFLSSQSQQIASAGNGSFAFQTLKFADSQGVSFSTGTQGIYATVKTDYLTTALTSQSNPAASAANGSFTFQTLPFADSNGVSFSTGTQGIYATVKTDYLTTALTSQSNQAASAGNGSFTFQTLPFADSNGVSFSTGTQGVYATVKTDYLTTALTSQSNQALSAANGSFTFQTATFADSNGVSFSTGTQGIYATVKTDYLTTALTSQSNQALSAANGSFTFQTATFADSNGVSFSTGTQGIFATVKTDYLTAQTNQTIGGYAVGNTTGESSSSTFDARTLSFRGQGIASVGYSNSSILISVPPASGDGFNNIAAGTQTANTTGTVLFQNSNGLTFGMSNSSVVTASYTVPSVAGLLSAVNVSAGTTSNNLSAITFADSNGISFGLDASTITASHNALTSQSNQAASAANGSFTFQTLKFADSQGVSFATGTQGVFATVKTDYLTSQSNQALSGSNGSFTFQTATFGNLNGMSFYSSNGSMVGSYTVPTQSNQTLGFYASSQTVGQSSSSTFDARSLSVVGDGIISVGWSNSSFRISATTVAQTNQSLGIYASSQTIGQSSSSTYDARSLSIVGDGIISVGWSNSSLRISASVAAQSAESQSFGMSNIGNTSGTTGIASGAQVRYLFAGGNNVTLSQSINGASGTVTISAFNQTVESQSIGMSNLGNTSGTTGIASGGQVRFLFAGGNNVTLSQSVNGASGTITISAGAGAADGYNIIAAGSQTANTTGTIVFSNSNGISFGMSNSSIVTASYTVPTQSNQSLGIYASSQTTGASSSSTFDARSLTIVADGMVSAGWTNGSFVISSPTPLAEAYGNTIFTTATTLKMRPFQVSAIGPMSVGFSNGASGGALIMSAAAHTLSQTIGMSTLGNTLGENSPAQWDQVKVIFVGGNNITLSQHTANFGAEGTVSIIGPNQALSGSNGSFSYSTATFGNLNNHSFYTSNGSMVVSYSQPPINFWPDPPPAIVLTNMLYSGSAGAGASTSATTLSVWVMPLKLAAPLVYNEIRIPVLVSATTTVTSQNWSATNGFTLGIYTMNASTLSLQESYSNKILFSCASTNTSGSGSATFQMSFGGSDTNGTSVISLSTNRATGAGFWTSVSGSKMLPFRTGSSTTSLSAGQYYLIFGGSVNSGGSALGMHVSSAYHVSNYIAALQDMCFDTQSTTCMYPLLGIASSEIATNQLWYNSFNTTRITTAYNNVSRVSRSLYVHFMSRQT